MDSGVPLGDALDKLKDYAARTMGGLSEEERSDISRARRNTEAMKKLGIAAALGISGGGGRDG